jgi:hypothetical protein
MIKKQNVSWPRLIGGPLHGEPVPDTTDRSLVGYIDESQPANTKYYHEIKYLFGKNIALRVVIYEGALNDRYDEMMEDVIIHALATVGITVEK